MKTPKLGYQFIKGEVQTERSYDDMEKLWKDYVKKMMDSTPDPVVSAKSHRKDSPPPKKKRKKD